MTSSQVLHGTDAQTETVLLQCARYVITSKVSSHQDTVDTVVRLTSQVSPNIPLLRCPWHPSFICSMRRFVQMFSLHLFNIWQRNSCGYNTLPQSFVLSKLALVFCHVYLKISVSTEAVTMTFLKAVGSTAKPECNSINMYHVPSMNKTLNVVP